MFQTNLVPAQNESPYLSNSFGNHFFMLTLSDRLAHTAKVFQGQQTSAATEDPIQDFFSFFFLLFSSSCINKALLFVLKPAGHIAHVPREEMSVRDCKISQRWTKRLIFFFNGHDFKYNPHFHSIVQHKSLHMCKTHN